MKRQSHGGNGGGRCGQQFFLIGTVLAGLLLWPAATYGDVYWTGVLSEEWSNAGNWWANLPLATDNVVFNTSDTSIVDTDFTIGRLRYQGNSAPTLDLAGGSHLWIANGPLQVGWDGDAAVTWTNGGLVTVGTPTTSQAIDIAHSAAASGTTTASLTINGVQVDAHLQSGGMAVGANYSTGNANGTLTLGSGSQLNAGTPASPLSPSLTIGYNHGLAGSGTGLVDTSGGAANLYMNELYVGNNKNGETGALGSASGTLTMGDNTALTATTAHIGRGASTTGVVNMNGGQFTASDVYVGRDGGTGTMQMNGGLFAANAVRMGSGSTFNFNAGRLAVTDFYTYGNVGTLEQKGGTMAPSGVSTIHGDYQLDAPGTLEIELFGDVIGTGYDQLKVTGTVNLMSGNLDLKLNYEPLVDTQFVIIDSDGGVTGAFAGLTGGSTLDEMYLDSTYRFLISYNSFGTGNDVMLKMIEKIGGGAPVTIPAPGALVLGGIGVGLLNWLRRRRTL